MRLLFVENNILFMGMAMSQCLESFDVVCALTVRDGRAHLEAEAFDVLLVGVELDDGTGEELIREFRQRFRGAIVAMSHSDVENDRLVDAGADGSCSKSNVSSLPAAISAALWKRAGALWRNAELEPHGRHPPASVQEPEKPASV